jgi:hypothetical protein
MTIPIEMAYDYHRVYPTFDQAPNVFTSQYAHEQGVSASMTHPARSDPRVYPIGGAVGGIRTRGGGTREDEALDNNGNARRRIAVAVSQISCSILHCYTRF